MHIIYFSLNITIMLQKIDKLSDREYRSVTGIKKDDFLKLAKVFEEVEQEIKEVKARDYQAIHGKTMPQSGGKPVFVTAQEKLFFLLFYLKTYPTYDATGFTFGCSGKTIHENLNKLLPILEKVLEKLQVLPKRNFKSPQEFIDFTKDHDNILIDATDRLYHRKKDKDEQKKYYNGKHKAHTVKNTVISTTKQVILFLGYTVLGAVHDYKLLNQEFPSDNDWFINLKVWVDLGYQGFQKDYVTQETKIPYKNPPKSKNNPSPQLSEDQKKDNRTMARVRVKIENAIGGMKRYNILVQRFKNKSNDLLDKVIFIASGLWNYNLNYTFNK